MPNLADHQSNEFTKLLLIGDSKSGKTGSLVSLVKAGYKLRILDMDNLLDVLKYYVQAECPDKIGNVEYLTIRDAYKATPTGPVLTGPPKAFITAIKMLDHWAYDGVDLGAPKDWGPDCVLVLDSLSRFCDAAFEWREPITPKGKSGDYDKRATYHDAQTAVEKTLLNLTGDSFETNVIVIAHVQYIDMPDGSKKGFPQGIGQKLSPIIPQYFPSIVLYTNRGGKRTLQTNSCPLIDLANPKPFAMAPSYPIETGLAEFFKVLRSKGEAPRETKPEPKLIKPGTIRR